MEHTVIPTQVKPIKLISSGGDYLLTSSQPLYNWSYLGSVPAIQGGAAAEDTRPHKHLPAPGKTW